MLRINREMPDKKVKPKAKVNDKKKAAAQNIVVRHQVPMRNQPQIIYVQAPPHAVAPAPAAAAGPGYGSLALAGLAGYALGDAFGPDEVVYEYSGGKKTKKTNSGSSKSSKSSTKKKTTKK